MRIVIRGGTRRHLHTRGLVVGETPTMREGRWRVRRNVHPDVTIRRAVWGDWGRRRVDRAVTVSNAKSLKVHAELFVKGRQLGLRVVGIHGLCLVETSGVVRGSRV